MNDRDLAEKIINDVLSSDEFQPEKAADLSNIKNILEFIKKILDKIQDFIMDIFEWFFNLFGFNKSGKSLSGLGNTVEFVLTLVGIILIGVLVVFLVMLVTKILKKYSFKKEIGDELEELAKTPDEPLKLAAYYKDIQDYRQSFRYYFIALLVSFNEKELIKIQRFKTNRIYFKEVYETNTQLASESESFFQVFDLYWYGKREVTEEILNFWQDKFMYLTKQNEASDTNE